MFLYNSLSEANKPSQRSRHNFYLLPRALDRQCSVMAKVIIVHNLIVKGPPERRPLHALQKIQVTRAQSSVLVRAY